MGGGWEELNLGKPVVETNSMPFYKVAMHSTSYRRGIGP